MISDVLRGTSTTEILAFVGLILQGFTMANIEISFTGKLNVLMPQNRYGKEIIIFFNICCKIMILQRYVNSKEI